MPNNWLTTTQAASYAAVHPETLRKAARLGQVRCVRRGEKGHFHFTRLDLDLWLGKSASDSEDPRND